MRLLLPLVLLCALVGDPAASAATRLQVRNRHIEQNQTLSQALYAAELSSNEVATVLGALEGVFDFRKSRTGDQFRIVRREGALEPFDYRRSSLAEWLVRREGEEWVGTRRAVEVRKEVARFPPWPYFVARGLYTTTSNSIAQLPTTCQE